MTPAQLIPGRDLNSRLNPLEYFLQIHGCKNLRDSIKDYIQEETLDRVNKTSKRSISLSRDAPTKSVYFFRSVPSILLASSICYPIKYVVEYFCRKILEGYSGYSGYNI
ncbi:hypothetical protein RIR_jg4428.t1 [Rhizophagus irregularis DAOM 181602=DAOM 197198]|nr:hypothetical protein RIR_jg4428.t1 [Rhizophagus irregularis DAOM 181602=DAOM 197198]